MGKSNKKGMCCFICGTLPARNEESSDVKIGGFPVNKTRKSEWEPLILKPGLAVGSRLCDRHFDIADIIRGREIGGVFYPYDDYWRLSDGAKPKHFLGNIAFSIIYK